MTDQPVPEPMSVAEAVRRLAAARDAVAALRPRLQAGEPWPLAVSFGVEPEASWGPREVLAHTAEMLPFWLGEYERVVASGVAADAPVPFGRVADDPLRIGILERDRTLPLRELFDRIDTGTERWIRRLGATSDEDGAALGRHARLGEMTASRLRDRFVVTHLEEHAVQLEELLGQR